MVKPLTKKANLLDRIKREGEPSGSPFLILLVLEGVAEFTLFDLLYASRVLILITKQVMKSNLTKTSLIFTCEHSKMFAVKFGLGLVINILGKKNEE